MGRVNELEEKDPGVLRLALDLELQAAEADALRNSSDGLVSLGPVRFPGPGAVDVFVTLSRQAPVNPPP